MSHVDVATRAPSIAWPVQFQACLPMMHERFSDLCAKACDMEMTQVNLLKLKSFWLVILALLLVLL
jgi:hypothetical protein